MLEARTISCVKGDRLLFDDLNLHLRPGEACQVLGGNGAGKTTLLRILCGLSLPDSGDVLWNGLPIGQDLGQFQCDLAYIGHTNGIKSLRTSMACHISKTSNERFLNTMPNWLL